MTIITKLYEKYIQANAESQEISQKIHRLFLDKVFAFSNHACVMLSLLSSFIVYVVMLLFPHDMLLHYWFIGVMLFFLNRFIMVYFYKDGGTIFFFKRVPEVSQELIAFMSAIQGLLWLFLIAIVMMEDIYPWESKVIAAGFLMLYTFGGLAVYSIIPMWGTFFIPVVFVPICIALLFKGMFWAISGIVILIYVFALLGISYRNYEIYFRSNYQQYENQKLLEKLDKLAKTDSLTGAINRINMDEILERAFKQAGRSNFIAALLFIDFDGFKNINDTYGHHVGDELLKSVVCRLKNFVRKTDELFRIGGDEFVIMLTNIDSKNSVESISTKILEFLASPHVIDGKSIVSNVSIGIGLYPTDGKTPQELLHCADIAMYKSKQAGGKTFTFYKDGMENTKKQAGNHKAKQKSELKKTQDLVTD